jgi:predicted enzyme related to lactoylglutathione lyase
VTTYSVVAIYFKIVLITVTKMSFQYSDAFLTIAALDFERVVKYYQCLLQIEPNPNIANVYTEFKLPSLRLGIFNPKKSHQKELANSVGSGMSLCLEVENLEVAIAHLTEMGYPPPGEIAIASHGREIYAYDPAGNRIILHESKII